MTDLIRDAPIGQILRYITGHRILKYEEEKDDFAIPTCYTTAHAHNESNNAPVSGSASFREKDELEEKPAVEPSEPVETAETPERASEDAEDSRAASNQRGSSGLDRHVLERLDTSHSESEDGAEKVTSQRTKGSQMTRVSTRQGLAQSHTRAELEAAFSAAATLEAQPSRPIVAERTADGTILVDWYTTDDPENPQNWSSKKKFFASLQIYLYTLAVYMGSAIYSPSIPGVMKEFGVTTEEASLGLSLYVLAYGMGPLIFSPLSEIPSIGRNPPYMITMAIFVILCVPAALSHSFAGLMVLRFLQGFFGSPCLATGGASLQDMYSLIKLPYVLCIWALAATGGPSLGPVISGFSVTAENWRWSLWEMLWLSGPVFLMMLLFLPETSTSNILLRRAQRLRKLTGNPHLKAQSEIDQANMRPREIAYEALVRPLQLIVMDPAIGFTAGYVALSYAIYYSFFEAFPLVYIEKYHFNLGEMGLAFTAIIVGAVLSIVCYYAYLYYVMEPDIRENGLGAPEKRLIPALAASFLLPIGLFIFAWTGDASVHVHWIVSIIGNFIFTIGIFILLQCIFVYLPLVYPQYAASLFAGNDFARSALAFAAVMFSRPMYVGIGVGPGTSILAALTAACIGGIFVLYFFGAKLRARSRFSAK